MYLMTRTLAKGMLPWAGVTAINNHAVFMLLPIAISKIINLVYKKWSGSNAREHKHLDAQGRRGLLLSSRNFLCFGVIHA